MEILNPVGNTNQWKEIKVRGAVNPKQMRKENVAVEKNHNYPSVETKDPTAYQIIISQSPFFKTAVNASLSNWLMSSNIDTLLSKKSIPDGWLSRKNQEDRVMLDITNL
ncbi:hypothetical protein V6N11_063191 [Hibiscus sabdariffa]|uniref:Uncharacterized protein n=1 Tax=Hibiscus sabdariffa TaxID=183260 RepID=A0ABR2NWR1_9ROSI